MINLNNFPTAPIHKKGFPWTEETNPVLYKEKQDWPKISIVTPSYNQGQFIEETIRSVLLQNYPNLEYVIIDGGSFDDTLKIIQKYEEYIDCWVSEPDKGQSNAIEKGFQKCSGEIITWLNSDDYLLDKALFYIGSFQWKPETGAVVGRGHKIRLNGTKIYSPKQSELNTDALIDWVNNHFMQPACFFKQNVFWEVGGFDKNLYGAFDHDLWIKISKKYQFELLNEDIAHAYHQKEAKTVANSERVYIENILLMTKYGKFELSRKYALALIDELSVYKRNRDQSLINRLKIFFIRLYHRVIQKIKRQIQ